MRPSSLVDRKKVVENYTVENLALPYTLSISSWVFLLSFPIRKWDLDLRRQKEQ